MLSGKNPRGDQRKRDRYNKNSGFKSKKRKGQQRVLTSECSLLTMERPFPNKCYYHHPHFSDIGKLRLKEVKQFMTRPTSCARPWQADSRAHASTGSIMLCSNIVSKSKGWRIKEEEVRENKNGAVCACPSDRLL